VDPKGRFIGAAGSAIPPWNPTLGYAFGSAIGVLLVLLGLSIQHHWKDGVVAVVFAIFFCLAALAGTLLVRIPRSIRLYEHGLEVDIPRSMNKSAWLPWSALLKYEWEGDVLRYAWQPNGVIVLAGGRQPARWPMGSFPNAVRIPPQQQSEVSGLLRRQAPPPRR
jgi:hypothetical protein